jgi:hypothetical protein
MLEGAGLSVQFCGTWIRSLQSDHIVSIFGADPSSATVLTMHELHAERWRLPGDQPILLIGFISDTHMLVIEPQSFLGAQPDRLRLLSSGGGQAINIYWTVNLHSRLALARDGAILTAFSLAAPYADREGTDPGYLDQDLEAAAFPPGQEELDYFDDRVAMAFALVGRLTGAMAVNNDWFDTPQRQYLAPPPRRRR